MTEEAARAEPQPATEAAPEPTLESLYEEYNVTPAETPPAATTTTEPSQPAGNEDVAAIHQEIGQFRRELAADRDRRARDTDEADLKNAIATLGEESGIKKKDLMLRGYLIAKASEDQRLRALWEKRADNPAAWSKALKILAGEVKKEFEVPNPQLEENQRAMEESQRAVARAPQPESREAQAMQMSEAEFSNFWRTLARRG